MSDSTRVELPEKPSILAFCLAGIGDTLMFTPALEGLKRAFPESQVTIVTMLSGAKAILDGNPFVDELVHFDFQREGLVASLRFLWGVRKRKFDVALMAYPSNRLEYNAISILSGCRVRIGHRYAHLDRVCGNWLKHVSVAEDDSLSNIEENLRLVHMLSDVEAESSVPAISLTDGERNFAVNWLSKQGLDSDLLVGMHPGSDARKNHTNKRWPAEYFIELGKTLARESSATVLVFGGSDEEELTRRIARDIGEDAHALTGLSLRQACALIESCRHFVSNDSGLMHVAGALTVETTAAFGPTSIPAAENPHASRTDISLGLPCQPCFYYSPRHLRCKYGDFRCLRNLPVETVLNHVKAKLDDVRSLTKA